MKPVKYHSGTRFLDMSLSIVATLLGYIDYTNFGNVNIGNVSIACILDLDLNTLVNLILFGGGGRFVAIAATKYPSGPSHLSSH